MALLLLLPTKKNRYFRRKKGIWKMRASMEFAAQAKERERKRERGAARRESEANTNAALQVQLSLSLTYNT